MLSGHSRSCTHQGEVVQVGGVYLRVISPGNIYTLSCRKDGKTLFLPEPLLQLESRERQTVGRSRSRISLDDREMA